MVVSIHLIDLGVWDLQINFQYFVRILNLLKNHLNMRWVG